MTGWSFSTGTYRLDLSPDGLWAAVQGGQGRAPLRLSLLSSVHTSEGPDETLSVGRPEEVKGRLPPEVVARVLVRRRSTRWSEAYTEIDCGPSWLVFRSVVSSQSSGARGGLTDVTLLGGRSLLPKAPGMVYSGSELPQLFSPNPEDTRLVVHPASAPAVSGGCGDSLPGRGHWFFTPPPLYFALGQGRPEPRAGAGGNGLSAQQPVPQQPVAQWVGIALLGPVDEMWFTELAYVPADLGFHLRLAYEGHMPVTGGTKLPEVLVVPGLVNPYDGIRAQRERLLAQGHIKAKSAGPRPAWWDRPMFCGWGAQCYLAREAGSRPQDQCTQTNYDRFLAELGAQGINPPTVVIDDGWQDQYGRVAPHRDRWPDLRSWVAQRHRQGQKVLLWWKAWDPEGVEAEWCVTNPDGEAVALDPGHPGAQRLVAANINELLSPEGLDADGLKVDFTARTPTGYALRHAGPWGLALLHEHLAQIYSAAKRAKPDALVITHAVNPAFADVADMLRLNDIMRLDEQCPDSPVVYQMKYRASVVRAACPELLVDTDDWCQPDLARWREYMAVKASLGVPALYYTTHLDRTGEAFEPQDYEMLRQIFTATPEGVP